jgi:phosphoribosylaminoimidazolecarboxamide formyltransferase/IMP cyclohydrolase
VVDLAYGENPHQRAALYAEVGARRHILSRVEQLQGDELSFNNLADLSAARAVSEEFAVPRLRDL